MYQHIPVQLFIEQPYATAELHLGPSWKVAPLDELLAKLRDYFGKEALHIEYQVKSKLRGSRARAPGTYSFLASNDISMDEALELYQAEVSQYS